MVSVPVDLSTGLQSREPCVKADFEGVFMKIPPRHKPVIKNSGLFEKGYPAIDRFCSVLDESPRVICVLLFIDTYSKLSRWTS